MCTEQTLFVRLDPGPGYDAEKLDAQTRVVQQELRRLEGVSASRPVLPAEPGSRGEPIAIGSLIVGVMSGSVLTAIVQLLRDWALRAENRRVTIKTTIDGNSLEVEYTPAGTSEKDLLKFVEAAKKLLSKPEKPAEAAKDG